MGRIFFVLVVLGYLAVALITALLAAAVVFQLAYDGDSKTEALFLFSAFALVLVVLVWRTSNPAILGLRGEDKHQHRAMAYAGLGMMDRALGSIDRHLQTHIDDPEPHCLKARLLMSVKRWREAFDELDHAVELDRTSTSLALRAQVCRYLGLDADAALDLERVYEMEPSCTNRMMLVTALGFARRLDRVLELTNEAPPDHELCVWHARAEALLLLGRKDEARRGFERVLAELDPSHPHHQNWLYTKVDTLGHLGRNDECMALIRRIDPSQTGMVKVARAVVALRDGNSRPFIDYARFALKVQPSWVIAFLADPESAPNLATDERLREVLGLALLRRREMIADLGRPVGIF